MVEENFNFHFLTSFYIGQYLTVFLHLKHQIWNECEAKQGFFISFQWNKTGIKAFGKQTQLLETRPKSFTLLSPWCGIRICQTFFSWISKWINELSLTANLLHTSVWVICLAALKMAGPLGRTVFCGRPITLSFWSWSTECGWTMWVFYPIWYWDPGTRVSRGPVWIICCVTQHWTLKVSSGMWQ